jgi:hypothetical protein
MDSFVTVGSAELGGRRGEVVTDGTDGQGRSGGDLLDRYPVAGQLEHVSLPRREWAISGTDGLGGQLRVDVPPATVSGTHNIGAVP